MNIEPLDIGIAETERLEHLNCLLRAVASIAEGFDELLEPLIHLLGRYADLSARGTKDLQISGGDADLLRNLTKTARIFQAALGESNETADCSSADQCPSQPAKCTLDASQRALDSRRAVRSLTP